MDQTTQWIKIREGNFYDWHSLATYQTNYTQIGDGPLINTDQFDSSSYFTLSTYTNAELLGDFSTEHMYRSNTRSDQFHILIDQTTLCEFCNYQYGIVYQGWEEKVLEEFSIKCDNHM